jgi:hypothetical protein
MILQSSLPAKNYFVHSPVLKSCPAASCVDTTSWRLLIHVLFNNVDLIEYEWMKQIFMSMWM